ncbi:EamA family transporter [Cupriavidus sp. CP313]
MGFVKWIYLFTLANWLGYAWLSIVGAGFSYALWFRGVGRMPSSAVAALGLLSPVSATVLGFLVLGQRAATPAAVARTQPA